MSGYRNIPNLFKVTVIKGKKVFVLIFQPLDIVGHTLGEVPDVPRVELLGGEATVLVDATQEKGSIIDKPPFSLGSCVIITLSSNGTVVDINLPPYASAAPE